MMPGNIHFLPIPAFEFAPANWNERGFWMNLKSIENKMLPWFATKKCSGRFEEEEANHAPSQIFVPNVRLASIGHRPHRHGDDDVA